MQVKQLRSLLLIDSTTRGNGILTSVELAPIYLSPPPIWRQGKTDAPFEASPVEHDTGITPLLTGLVRAV